MTTPTERPLHPKTPHELLLTTYHASTREHADQILGDFGKHGFELVAEGPLDAEQRARVEALRRARELVGGKHVLGGPAGLTLQQTSELVPLARYILTGHEAPLPPQRYLLGPLGEDGDLDDQGDVADVLRTPDALRKAMQTAAAARP